MADGFQGYNKVQDTRRCTCWAHIRRYLLEAIPKGKEKDYSHRGSSTATNFLSMSVHTKKKDLVLNR
jgi:hypothetical protein